MMYEAVRGERRQMRGPDSARAVVAVLFSLAVLVASGIRVVGAAPPPPPSGVGDANVFGIAVSPAYRDTGLVVATVQPLGTQCSRDCLKLWVSHDGGSSWELSPAVGWNQGRPVIAADEHGSEKLFAGSGSDLRRSSDDGSTWTVVSGAAGTAFPAVSPRYASDTSIAGAMGTQDFVLHGSTVQPVAGSGGTIVDMAFSYAPSYPTAGRYAPVLLTGVDTHGQLPVIQRCTAEFICSGNATLSGASTFSAPALLFPSSGYADDGVVFAQSGKGIYRSTDGGVTFAPLPMGDPTATSTATPSFALAPGYRQNGPVQTAYASLLQIHLKPGAQPDGPSSGGVYRTTDGGATWSSMGSPSPLDGGSMAVAVAPDGRVFAGYIGSGYAAAGLLCSSDGQTWQASCPSVGHYWRDHPRGSSAHAAPAAKDCQASNCAAGPATGASTSSAVTAPPAGGVAGTTSGGEAAQRMAAAVPQRRFASPQVIGALAGGVMLLSLAGLRLRSTRRRVKLRQQR